jgi:lipopolysaccharide/colanic/teichoic acid biosynthesis glycosyltransferase
VTPEALQVRAPDGGVQNEASPGRIGYALRYAARAGALAVVALATTVLYALVIRSLTGQTPLRSEVQQIVASTLANLIVVVGSWNRRGQIHERVTRLSGRILWAHGVLALVVVATHSPYSNVLMLLATLVSALLGGVLTLVNGRLNRLRTALIGPADGLDGQIGAYGVRVADPTTDLRRYDLILTTFAEDIPSDWAKPLSRALLAGRRVRHASEYLEEARGLVLPEHFDVDLLDGERIAAYEAAKRIIDVLLTLAFLPIALTVLALAALAIRLTMGGPVLFRQERVGRGGRLFRMLKLRTMTALPADAEAEVATTQPADPRITALGRFLRRLHIDELPQLWHVLTGQMSLIGPRPEWSLLAEDYVRQAPVYAFRHLVRPGITGWAQVRSGYAADLRETRLKLAYDLYYVKNFSFALDLQIMARTALITLSGRGWR